MNKQEEIIEVCGKKVVVRYARTQEDACASCAFSSRKECHDLDCNMRDIVGESVCKYAYFVEAEQQVPADVQEAAEIRKINITPDEVRYIIDAIPGADGIFRSEENAKRGLAIFKAGMLAERERLMKEAPVADVIEMRGSTGPFADYPFMLSLGFRKIPNIEYHGGKVRVIIEEIKEEGK